MTGSSQSDGEIIPVRLMRRFLEFMLLEKDWDGHGAEPVNRSSLKHALILIEAGLQAEFPVPSIVPTKEGYVTIEWHCEGEDIEVTVLPDGNIVVYRDLPRYSTGLWERLMPIIYKDRSVKIEGDVQNQNVVNESKAS